MGSIGTITSGGYTSPSTNDNNSNATGSGPSSINGPIYGFAGGL